MESVGWVGMWWVVRRRAERGVGESGMLVVGAVGVEVRISGDDGLVDWWIGEEVYCLSSCWNQEARSGQRVWS